jgi:tRNA A37 threonylcarbamoyladenosine synthetase subunit TsaC/SUA5/YrdC
MSLFNVEADARRVYEVLADGGVGIIPTDVGYVILGVTSQAIWKIFRAKRRKPEKLNAMCGCREMHAAIHDLPDDRRAIVEAITEDYGLPLGVVAPARLEHPTLAGLDADVLDQTTDNGTVAMLLNAGPMLDTLARIGFADGRLIIGSSANLSLRGVKFRASDIEPEIIEAADIVIDYGLMRWNRYAKSSTMIDIGEMRVVRHGSCFDLIDDLLRRHFDIALPAEPD